MTRNTNQPHNRTTLRAALLSAAAALLFASAAPVSAQTYTWVGASTVSSNWSDPANWTVSPTSVTSTVPPTGAATGIWLYFPGRTTFGTTVATNDLTGVSGIDGVAFNTTNGVYYGNPVTLDPTPPSRGGNVSVSVTFSNLYSGAGSNNWAMDTAFNSTINCSVPAANINSVIAFSGLLSGTGDLWVPGSSAGQITLFLLNPNNTFSGAQGTATSGANDQGYGPISLDSGAMSFTSMAMSNQPSALGQPNGTGAAFQGMMKFGGWSGSGSPGTWNFIGNTDCITDLPWEIEPFQGGSSTRAFVLNNNSVTNSLTWTGPFRVGLFSGSTGPGTVYAFTQGGASTGTNTIVQSITTSGYQMTAGLAAGILFGWNMNGPGTFVHSGLTNGLNGALAIANSAHVVLQSNLLLASPSIAVGNGSTLDVSWNDTNALAANYGPYTIGMTNNMTLTAGHTGANAAGTPAADIIGSLALAPITANGTTNSGQTNQATLYPGGSGVIGTLTISPAPSTTISFVPGGANLLFDLGTNWSTAGGGSNDLIVVNGNVDFSKGTPSIQIKGAAFTTGEPYTLMTWTGNLTGNVTTANVVVPAGYTVVNVTTTGKMLAVQLGSSGPPPNLSWTGSINANWDTGSTKNWVTNGTANPNYFFGGDPVTFPDVASLYGINIGGDVSPAAIVVSNNEPNDYTLSGAGQITGLGGVLKEGTGSVTISTANNTFGGGFVISAGTVIADNVAALGSSTLTLGDTNTGTNSVSVLGTHGSMPLTMTVTTNCTNGVVIGNTGTGAVTMFGGINMSNTSGITLTNAGTSLTLGNITGNGNVLLVGTGGLCEWTAPMSFNGTITVQTVDTSTAGMALKVDVATVTAEDLNLGTNSILEIQKSLNFSVNALNGAGPALGNPSLIEQLAGYSLPIWGTLTIGVGDHSGEFDGNIVNFSTDGSVVNIVKAGAGTEIFTGDNSALDGTNEISGGILEADSTGNSSLPMGPITVDAGGTLDGNGNIQTDQNYNIIVNGTLMAGVPTNTTGSSLKVANATGNGYLALNGTMAVSVYSGAGAGDNSFNFGAASYLNVNLPTSLGAASKLVIGNPNNLTGFKIGDKWTVAFWNGNTPTNTFSSVTMQGLPGNLAVDASGMYNNGLGVIEIVAGNPNPILPATITSVSKSGANMIFNGTNVAGAGTGFHYVVLSSTVLNKPLTSWTPVATNAFNANGSFSFTNAIGAGATYFTTKVVQ